MARNDRQECVGTRLACGKAMTVVKLRRGPCGSFPFLSGDTLAQLRQVLDRLLQHEPREGRDLAMTGAG
jgi:hypothetical protein